MKTSIAAVLVLAATAQAHTFLDHIIADGKAVDAVMHTATYNTGTRNSPIKKLSPNPDLICGVGPVSKAAASASVAAGSTIQTAWGHNVVGDDIIDPSHKGSVNFYLAKATASGAVPTGDAWFKIQQQEFADGKWGTEDLIADKGVFPVTIPAQLPAGNYVLRSEVSALHEADALADAGARGIQFYIFCSQLTVTAPASNTALPMSLSDMANFYTDKSPGILFSIYNNPGTAYPTLGPAVAAFSKSGNSATPVASAASLVPSASAGANTTPTVITIPGTGAIATPTAVALASTTAADQATTAANPETTPAASGETTTAADANESTPTAVSKAAKCHKRSKATTVPAY
ncbi:hypothetical protein HKX48_003058 [Thoreauomyces humboldtii]|nr:hypothetical protein HKX48_003058 [Thoreauomyces humboldtii]